MVIRTNGLLSISRIRKDQALTFLSAWKTPPTPTCSICSFTTRCFPIMETIRQGDSKFVW